MREQRQNVSGVSPHKILCGLLFAVVALFSLSGTVSLKGKQLEFEGTSGKYVSLAGHIPELCAFTVCIDLNKTQGTVADWAPFSYDISSSSTDREDIELALSVDKAVLRLFLLGTQAELGKDFSAYTMHQVCCVWDGNSSLFELFHNGNKVKNLTLPNTTHKCLKPNGTLVMGHLHKNQDGHLSMISSLVGILHYFQMWDHVRRPQQMASCDEGNVVSWQGDYWDVKGGLQNDPAENQRCEEAEDATSEAPPLTTKAPDSTITVSFYNIQMNFSVSREPPEPFDYYDAQKLSVNWFKEKFHNSEFVVTNHYIMTNIRRDNALRRAMWIKAMLKMDEKQASQSYSSKSIVKATSNQTVEVIVRNLQTALSGSYVEDCLSMTVKTNGVTVASFDPKACPEKTVQSKYKGIFLWPKIIPHSVAYHSCERNREQNASRACLINMRTEKAYWKRQNLYTCLLLEPLMGDITALKNVSITVENAEEVADRILFLLPTSTLGKEEIEVLLAKLTDIANCEEISETLAMKALQIINAFMTEKANIQELQVVLNRILRLMEEIGFKMEFSGRNQSIVLPGLALALLRPDPVNFRGVAFGVISYNPHKDPELDIRETSFPTALASIFLPRSLKRYLGDQSFEPEDHTKIQFSFFGTTSLFEDSSLGNEILNTYIVGASIENASVQNLKDPVSIILQHIQQNTDDAPVRCVFWDFSKHNGLGGWDTSGCEMEYTDANYTVCNCSHLTHFGVLLDVSRTSTDDQILTLISYVGCGISSIFLGLALVVYLSIEKIRGDYPSRILINLSFALLMLNLTFLVNSWLASFHKSDLCIAVAVALHYFLLAAFTWMGLEAIHMYYALIKVFNTYIPNYMLKFAIVGWGVPAVIVATVLIISPDNYGTGFVPQSTSPLMLFCWIQDDVAFYISVVAYFCLVFLLNVGMFITVLLQIHAMKGKTPARAANWNHDFLHDLKRVASLTFLLGLTWGFAFFAWGPVKIFFMYLFAMCNTLQGFFIFIFHCLMKENVRKQCQMHFCCGRFRLSYPHWKSSATTLGYPHPKNLERRQSCHSLRSLKSCATSSTSNGSGGLPRARPDIGVKTGQVCCSLSHTSLTYQTAKLPRARKTSPMDVELECPQKNSFLR